MCLSVSDLNVFIYSVSCPHVSVTVGECVRALFTRREEAIVYGLNLLPQSRGDSNCSNSCCCAQVKFTHSLDICLWLPSLSISCTRSVVYYWIIGVTTMVVMPAATYFGMQYMTICFSHSSASGDASFWCSGNSSIKPFSLFTSLSLRVTSPST